MFWCMENISKTLCVVSTSKSIQTRFSFYSVHHNNTKEKIAGDHEKAYGGNKTDGTDNIGGTMRPRGLFNDLGAEVAGALSSGCFLRSCRRGSLLYSMHFVNSASPICPILKAF